MGSTVRNLMAAAGLTPAGWAPWDGRTLDPGDGVWLVALTADPDELVTSTRAPVSDSAVEALLAARPDLTVDGRRPGAIELVRRLRGLWLGDQTVVCVGPGSWLLQTLDIDLFLHHAPIGDPAAAETVMLDAFAAGVSTRSRAHLHDSEHVLPFANLEGGHGVAKGFGKVGD